MAIKYYNISDTSDNRFETLKGVLETVATDYFTSFEISEDKLTLTCYDGDNPLMVISRTSGYQHNKITLNGLSGISATNSPASEKTYCTRITTTACGVAIKFTINNADKSYGVFVTKTKNGKTAVFLQQEKTIGASSNNNYCVSSESSNAGIISKISSNTKSDHTNMTQKAYILVSGTDDYCPDLFQMINSPYYGTEGIIDIDGVKYLSNGYYTLKDE